MKIINLIIWIVIVVILSQIPEAFFHAVISGAVATLIVNTFKGKDKE